MQIITAIPEIRKVVGMARAEGKLVGLVPTMGALHTGHLALMYRARHECDFVVVSIFVNPTQFGPSEDFEKYPRDLQDDARMAEEEDVDVIFAPSAAEIYPEGFSTYVSVQGPLTETLEGCARPGHFRGVTTVVAKLFGMVAPDKAYFGMKDYQQSQVIRKMVSDLNMVVDIVPVPTVRESDGLAMSSRNRYLNTEERAKATILYRALENARTMVKSGERDGRTLQVSTQQFVETEPGVQVDYVAVVAPDTLEPITRIDGQILVALALRIGKTRLIDNMVVEPG